MLNYKAHDENNRFEVDFVLHHSWKLRTDSQLSAFTLWIPLSMVNTSHKYNTTAEVNGLNLDIVQKEANGMIFSY